MPKEIEEADQGDDTKPILEGKRPHSTGKSIEKIVKVNPTQQQGSPTFGEVIFQRVLFSINM